MPLALQHPSNRTAAYLVTQIGQGALNAAVAPARIVLRHAHDQFRDMTHDAGPARAAAVGEVPLLSNETPMPPHKRIRRNNGVELKQGFAPYCLRPARQQRPFRVGESDSLSPESFFEQPILRLEQLDYHQLKSMNPARHNH